MNCVCTVDSGGTTSATVTSYDHGVGVSNLNAIDTNKYLTSPASIGGLQSTQLYNSFYFMTYLYIYINLSEYIFYRFVVCFPDRVGFPLHNIPSPFLSVMFLYILGMEDTLAAVIKQERDSSSAEAAALSAAATALNDLHYHISHRDNVPPIHGRDHVPPIHGRDNAPPIHGRDSIHITPRGQEPGQTRSNSGLLSPTKLPPASVFKHSALTIQVTDHGHFQFTYFTQCSMTTLYCVNYQLSICFIQSLSVYQ